MFKNTGVLSALIFASLHLISACSSLASQSINDFAASSRQMIARELAAASIAQRIDSSKPIYIQAKSNQDWLRKSLVDELTANQYVVASDPVSGQLMTVVATEIGHDALHVSLTLGDGPIIERVFQFERNVPRRASMGFFTADGEHFNSLASLNTNDGWASVRNMPLATRAVRLPSLETATTLNPEDFGESVNTSSDECPVASLQQGSLKRNLVQILQGCGWRLIGWPRDLGKPNHELDWLVPNTKSLSFKSLADFARDLEVTFTVEIELNESDKTMRVQLRK